MPGTILFVYGTLKRGLRNHHRLGNATFRGPARTRSLYRLLDLGWYPGLVVAADQGVAVEGELWEVDDRTLRRLDEYEGVPKWFDRCRIVLEVEVNGVEAYYYRGDPSGKDDCGANWRP